jgi:thioredoxin reductase (NADPH)
MAAAFDIVVAGAGIAGLTAGMEAARLGRKTLILTGGVFGGHLLSIEKIDGYPGFPDGVAGYELVPLTQGQAVEAGAELAMTEITALDPDGDNWRVTAGNGDYLARAVIIATGTGLKTLDIPGEERLRGKGVSHCASCDAPLLRDRPVAVVGGGDSALQEALTLAGAASRVTILHRGDGLSGQAAYRARVEANSKIDIRFNSAIAEIVGDGVVSGVRLQGSGEMVDVDGVFIYVGLRPETAFLANRLDLSDSGHIKTDNALRTGLKGVLAAGTVREGAAGRAVAAAGDGTLAAVSADRYLADGGWSA